MTKSEHPHVDPVTGEVTNQLPAVPSSLPPVSTGSEPAIPSTGHRVPAPFSPAGIGDITAAIAAVTGEVGSVAKGGYNDFHRYKYVKAEDITNALNPVLAKHGLAIVTNEISREWVDRGEAVAVTYEYWITHSGGQWIGPIARTGLSSCRSSTKTGGKFDDKCFNKCATQAFKYFTKSLFQIETEPQDDADAGSHDRGVAGSMGARTQSAQPSSRPGEQAGSAGREAHHPPKEPSSPGPILSPLDDPERTWAGFGTDLAAGLKGSKSLGDLELWIAYNAKPLDRLYEAGATEKKFHARLMKIRDEVMDTFPDVRPEAQEPHEVEATGEGNGVDISADSGGLGATGTTGAHI